jgi:hypothetical protein
MLSRQASPGDTAKTGLTSVSHNTYFWGGIFAVQVHRQKSAAYQTLTCDWLTTRYVIVFVALLASERYRVCVTAKDGALFVSDCLLQLEALKVIEMMTHCKIIFCSCMSLVVRSTNVHLGRCGNLKESCKAVW